MIDELIGPEDLSQLRILSKIDHRAEDSWAFDDTFVEDFLKIAGPQHSKYSSLIKLYWREKRSRREVAILLGMTLDGMKSLITTIRRKAEDFSRHLTASKEGGSLAGLETAPAPTTLRCRTIHKQDILNLIEGDEQSAEFVEEYGRLSVLNILNLFDSDISTKLIELQNRCDALSAEKTQSAREQISKILSEADELKFNDAARKHDPLGPVLSFTDDLRTNYAPGVRGRPPKPKLAPEIPSKKRKRGRPRKLETPAVEIRSTDPPEMAETFVVAPSEYFYSAKDHLHV